MTDYILTTLQGLNGGQLLLVALLAGLAHAAANDLCTFRIPNGAVVAIVIVGAFWAMTYGAGLGFHLAGAALVLAVGFIAYLVGVFGAGDAKLFAAVAFFTGPYQAVDLAFQTAIFGGVLTFLWIGSRPVRLVLTGLGFDVEPDPPNRIPYGIAIAAAGIVFVGRHWAVAV